MKTKKILIELTQRTETHFPTFQTSLEGMERYEAIGILTLAIDQIKDSCFNDTVKMNNFNP